MDVKGTLNISIHAHIGRVYIAYDMDNGRGGITFMMVIKLVMISFHAIFTGHKFAIKGICNKPSKYKWWTIVTKYCYKLTEEFVAAIATKNAWR